MMNTNKLRLMAAVFAAVACTTTIVQAQQPAPTRVRGTLTEVTPDHLQIHTRDGKQVLMSLSKETQINSIAVTDLSAIKADSYIGTAAAPQADGTLKALEVHIFPPTMRGQGEGSVAWDLNPKNSMTNGAVGSIVGTDGRTLSVNYHGQTKKVFVPADVPIVNIDHGDASLLTKGAKVLVFASKNKDGSLSARMVNVGKGGITPPM